MVKGPLTKSLIPASGLIYPALALLPLLVLVFLISSYSVDVIFWDEWEMVPLLESLYQGRLSFEELWRQHNEHRIFFPRLILLAIIHLSRWNMFYEIAANVLIALATLASFVVLLLRTKALQDRNLVFPLIPVISLFVFSPRQGENWLWGIEMVIFLAAAVNIAGLVLLSAFPFRWSRFWAAALLGAAGVFSFSSGFAFLPAAFYILTQIPYRRPGERKAALGAWLLISAALVMSYLSGYQKPPQHPSLFYALEHPFEFVKYVLAFLGSFYMPLDRASLAVVLGAGGSVLFGVSALLLVKRGILTRLEILPYAAIAFYSIGNALLTGIARSGFGQIGQALSQRYVTISYPFWVIILIFLFILARLDDKVHGAGKAFRFGQAFKGMFLGLILGASAVSAVSSFYFDLYHVRFSAGREALLSASPDLRLLRIYPVAETVLQRIPFLKENRLSVFRKTE